VCSSDLSYGKPDHFRLLSRGQPQEAYIRT
jgi:hypothetical protein